MKSCTQTTVATTEVSEDTDETMNLDWARKRLRSTHYGKAFYDMLATCTLPAPGKNILRARQPD